jgi:predicted PurR-regulated permease PerM
MRLKSIGVFLVWVAWCFILLLSVHCTGILWLFRDFLFTFILAISGLFNLYMFNHFVMERICKNEVTIFITNFIMALLIFASICCLLAMAIDLIVSFI